MFKNIALAIITIISLPIILTWEIVTKKEFILSIDQGTSGTTVAIVNEYGEIVCSSYKEIHQSYPHPSWVEQDPIEIYQSVLDGIKNVINKSKIKPDQILSSC